MKYTDASYEIWEQEPGIQGIFKQIEKAGKICYHATDNITEDSARPFIDRLIKMNHMSPLEHGTVYLEIPWTDSSECKEGQLILQFSRNKYSVSNIILDNDKPKYVCITTNLRVLVENHPKHWEEILTTWAVDWDSRFEFRPSVYFTCDRFTGESFLRHRVFSFARESTRYCNYTKDKFNKEITYIDPFFSKKDKAAHELLTSALHYTEIYYKYLIQAGWKPEQARVVLPCAIKSPLLMTGFVSDWQHFFDLRALDKTGPAHPQAKELALPLYNEFKEKEWI